MNIKKAKEQIANTVKAYLEKDEYGRYVIQQNKQRPIFLMGPPGIGKTEIMSQTAAQLGIGLLSYSMTHHTRQSALGLPIIRHKEYDGEQFETSEYTMSEIISAVYDMMNHTGLKNGILFLDEINCVSETLTPVMLQFLQYKVFGGHRLPDGWVVVTAGNPPEYNSSVHEFDVVTWDRLKRIDVEPDFNVWKEYARMSGVHNSVLSYLDIKPQNFYRIETEAGGKSFVTARGWDDLSRIIDMYERLEIEVDTDLIKQYIHNKGIAEDFAVYYELYKKYKSDYKIGEILSQKADSEIINRAKNAGFDERYSLLGLILEALNREAVRVQETDELLTVVKNKLGRVKKSKEQSRLLEEYICENETLREKLTSANSLSIKRDNLIMMQNELLRKCLCKLSLSGFDGAAEEFERTADEFTEHLKLTALHFANAFKFCEKAFGAKQEMLILVTELAANPVTARYITEYGCDEYYKHDRDLMLHERRLEIIDEIEKLNI